MLSGAASLSIADASPSTSAGVSSSTILNYVHSGKVISVRLSERTIRIPRKAVIRLLGLESPAPRIIDRPDADIPA